MHEKKPNVHGPMIQGVRLRFRLRGNLARMVRQSNRWAPHPFAIIASVSLHAGLVALLLGLPFIKPGDESGAYVVSKVVPLTPQKKAIWYSPERELPRVSPSAESRKAGPPPRPSLVAPQRIVTAPEARKGRQFVWIPAPEIHLTMDLQAPNVIVIQAPSPPPAPARARPRIFQPPPEREKLAAPAAAVPAPPEMRAGSSLETAPGSRLLANRSLPSGPPPRAFVPPPSRGPDRMGVGAMGGLAPPELGGRDGGAGGIASDVTLAIIGLDPRQTGGIPVPAGERVASISMGPDSGSANGRGSGGGNAGISIPGVSVTGGAAPPGGVRGVNGGNREDVSPTPSPHPAIQTLRQLPSRSSMPPAPMVSAPHWPGARTLPVEIEKVFSGRVAYATVFPLPVRSASADWTLWFAERVARRSGSRSLMRPPAPVFQEGMPVPVISRSMLKRGNLELVGTLGQDGRLAALTTIAASDPALADSAIAALLKWQFTPATSSGTALDVDVVIVIPPAE